METKKIIVTGIGGNVGQGIIRNIRDTYPDIYIIGLDIAAFTPGNYLCDKTYVVPYSYEASYIPKIKEIISQENAHLILPSTDYEVFYLSQHRNELNAYVVASDANVSKIYLDKYTTYLYHKKNNIPFAKSWLAKDYDFSEKEIIAKPREGRGSRGILINPEHPEKLPENYMVQKLAKGKEITTAVYVTKSNELHGIFTMERSLTNGTTTKSKVIFDYDQQLSKIANSMIGLGGLKGSFNIQSIVDNNNNIIPFEINCRISGTNSIRHNLGFQDVIYAVDEYLYHKSPAPATPVPGMASRILIDVIYPGATDAHKLNNKSSEHKLY